MGGSPGYPCVTQGLPVMLAHRLPFDLGQGFDLHRS